MMIPEILTVRDARKNLPMLIESVRQGQMPVIGAHRKPAAMVVHPSLLDALTALLDGQAEQVAWELTEPQRRDINPVEDRDVLHPGDPAGKVLAWLWLAGQRWRLTDYVANIVYYMRVKYDVDGVPSLRFSALLEGIPMALPPSFPDDQVQPLIDHLRQELPGRFGHDVDEP